jgi:predicted TIM-barrel fold metal-dependent hydrolase
MSANVELKHPKGDSLVEGLAGRIRDVDSHEMIPALLWEKVYGEFAAPLAKLFLELQPDTVANSSSVRIEKDEVPISTESLASYWGAGCRAPGSFDMTRRLEFMDAVGIKDSIIFGTVMSLTGQQLAHGGGALLEKKWGGKVSLEKQWAGTANFDPVVLGQQMVKAHNDWCIAVAAHSPRLLPVATILTESLQDAVTESERVIGAGVRVVSVPAGASIEGKAPSHPDNDALWGLFAKHNVSVMLHVGGEKTFLREPLAWANAPQFSSNTSVPTEVAADPYSIVASSLAAQNYFLNLILGAVFERVPTLRFGIMELGGHWIGPLAENMDVWVEKLFARRYRGVLTMKPSEYVQRNIRVTPFNFEPVDKYIERFPFLEDVYCFSTDYPHYEGGKDPIQVMAERLQPLGADVTEKFFIRNAALVMPS